MELETVPCRAGFYWDNPVLRIGGYPQIVPFCPYYGILFTYIEKYCKIKKILIVYTNMCMHVYNIEVII